MAFCGKCGSSVNEGTAFCPQCGAAIAPPAAQPYGTPYAPPLAQTGMRENVAGMLCYLFGWLTGIIFLLIDKRPFVRFHAAQSIVVFGILHIIRLVLAYAWVGPTYFYGAPGWGFHLLVSSLLSLLSLALWIILMVMAYQGKKFEVPGAAPLAHSLAGKV